MRGALHTARDDGDDGELDEEKGERTEGEVPSSSPRPRSYSVAAAAVPPPPPPPPASTATDTPGAASEQPAPAPTSPRLVPEGDDDDDDRHHGNDRGSCRVCCEDVTLDVNSSGDTRNTAGGFNNEEKNMKKEHPKKKYQGGAGEAEAEDEVILLGCRCSQPCHRKCIEEWTRVKGDRICELCGESMTALPEPPPRAPRGEANDQSEDFTVVMRPGDDSRGERVIVITQSAESDVHGGVTIHRYYAAGGAGGDAADAAGDEGWRSEAGQSRAAECLSELLYLLCFSSLFLVFFGTPGAVMAGLYLAWYICVRFTFA